MHWDLFFTGVKEFAIQKAFQRESAWDDESLKGMEQ